MKISNTLVVFDLETTGAWVEKDKIVEIALIKMNVDGTQETYHKRVNPGIPIPPFVEKLIGISTADVQDEPRFENIGREVFEFIGEADFGGFNVERFDLPVLEREFSEMGIKFDWHLSKIYDAQKVYHVNEKRDLTAAYKFYCHKELENAHSALADTQATRDVLLAQIEKYGSEEDQGNIELLEQFKYNNDNEFYDEDRRFRWWNGKLYMMFGKYAKRHTLQEVASRDRGYLQWILSAGFNPEVKELVEGALNGKFPIPPEGLLQ